MARWVKGLVNKPDHLRSVPTNYYVVGGANSGNLTSGLQIGALGHVLAQDTHTHTMRVNNFKFHLK